MIKRILKLTAIFAAVLMISGIVGCGAKGPTTANNLTNDEQQKLVISTEIHTVADDTEIAVD